MTKRLSLFFVAMLVIGAGSQSFAAPDSFFDIFLESFGSYAVGTQFNAIPNNGWTGQTTGNYANLPDIVDLSGNNALRVSTQIPNSTRNVSLAKLNLGADLKTLGYSKIRISFDILEPSTNKMNIYTWWGNGDQRFGDNGYAKLVGGGAQCDSSIVYDDFSTVLYEFDWTAQTVNSWYNGTAVDVNKTLASTSGVPEVMDYLQFELRSDWWQAPYAGNAYIDNIKVQAVPEPGTFMAVGVGFASILGLMRRRK